MTPERESRAQRASGGPFAILYAPRANPDTDTAPQKRGPKPKVNPDQSYKAKVLRALQTTAPNFNTPIATQADSLRTQAIKGKL